MTNPPSHEGIVFEPKDEPLRDDVRTLGALLGEVITEQGGKALFERVETARQAARRRRRGDELAGEDLAGTLGNLAPTEAEQVVRAFSAYFNLVNMAEQVHRLRRRRDYSREGNPQPASFEWVLRELQSRGVSADDAAAHIENLLVVPVFTAHPTEAIRRTLLAKQQRIAGHLIAMMDGARLTPPEREEQLAAIRHEVTVAWQTDEHLAVRPTVADEVEHVLFYVSEVILDVVPEVHAALRRAMRVVYGRDVGFTRGLVTFGSWVGGDMDGNPAVGAETIRDSLLRHRELVLRHYRVLIRELFDHLSHSASRVTVDAQLLERVRAYSALFPGEPGRIPARYADMPYRELLWLMQARLDATTANDTGSYRSAGELLDDLRLIRRSLQGHGAAGAGGQLVERMITRAETFGFHLAQLDVRQDAEVHRRVAGALLGVADFAGRSADERTRLLADALPKASVLPREQWPNDDEVRKTLEVMVAIRECRETYGDGAIGPYIISMAQGPDDALALLYLARRGGLVRTNETGGTTVPLDVAPLFETVDDLANGPATMRALLADPVYRHHVRSRGDEQVVMLGYSDSNKDSGIASARWALYEAQQQLVAENDAAGVNLTLFHGRGGSTSRGGGKVRDAVLAQPRAAVRDRLRITEQGEIIHAKYGVPGIAERTFEVMIGAVLQASATEARTSPPDPRWLAAIQAVAQQSRRAYRDLVHHDEDLFAYFRLATPIDAIERLEIGSRPSSRRAKQGIQDLRAIPWVFAWTQSRHILPGWYGLGSGLVAAAEEHGAELLREMAAGWAPFLTLLADAEMVLAKADMPIALRYSRLAGDVGQRVFPRVRAEFERTRDAICDARQQSDLLDRDPGLRRAIVLRNPYIDPMSLLQIDLLRRWRATDRQDDELARALFTTVKGIARGLQNTG